MTRNLSPSPDRIRRVCVCVWHGGKILMIRHEGFWTFPGGGVHPGETFEEAATREAWAEAGAWVMVERFLWQQVQPEGQYERCYLATLLEQSPEGREVYWANPRAEPWCSDQQIQLTMEVLGALES